MSKWCDTKSLKKTICCTKPTVIEFHSCLIAKKNDQSRSLSYCKKSDHDITKVVLCPTCWSKTIGQATVWAMQKEHEESIGKSWGSQQIAAKSAHNMPTKSTCRRAKSLHPSRKGDAAQKFQAEIPIKQLNVDNLFWIILNLFYSQLCEQPELLQTASNPPMQYAVWIRSPNLFWKPTCWGGLASEEHDWARAKLQNVKSRKRTNKNVFQM